jgi:dihydrofolate reductase
MRKVIAAINMTIDGFCDHTAVDPDEEIHQYYADLLESGGVVLYGRKTFELMKFWQEILEHPSDEKAMDDFAKAIDRIPKIVFSTTLKSTEWDSAVLSTKSLEDVVHELKQMPGNDILVGSRGLINQLLKLNLIDEYQLCVHPVVLGGGLPLFEAGHDRTVFSLVRTKTFAGGAILLCYTRAK